MSVFIFIGIIVGGFAAYSVNRLRTTNEFVSNIANDWMPSVSLATRMQQDFSNLRLAYRDHIMALDDKGMKNAETDVTNRISAFLETTSQFEAIYTYQSELDIAKQVREEFKGYTDLGTQLMKLSANDNDEQAKILLATDMKPLAIRLIADIDKLIDINATGAKTVFAESQAIFSTTLVLTFFAIGLCAVVLLASIWFALTGIARPIQTITSAMTKLAGGDTKTAVPFAGRADEIGEMAGAVEVFRQAALSNKRLEEEAEGARIQGEADRVRLTAEAEAAAQKRLQEATSGLATGLRRLAAGDLGFQLNEPFAPDFEALRHDLNGAVSQLADTLRAVAQATTQIDSGTREISQSTDDLSKRTEQQAASLEQTAAALDQITANVSNSSKRADEARSVAVQANASAAHSGKVVASTVDAMQKIEQSSNQVSNIIGVIDEIAFQTNLLALNAGVEAARAGEAGKGFAVVAQEVRELAQRSAKAAKEIKELIRNSSVEVQSGVKLVSETGEALKTIEGYIVAVNQHMDAIATSAREQSVGLAEVNTAVNQMDQVTQQNAAMVEESNAASATLAGEAGTLRELIGRFQFGEGKRQMAPVTAAGAPNRAVASPARRLTAQVAKAYGGNTAAESWEEF
ncbi:methyl-accepting chemotaxis protein [Agrobacterium vitis]|uniref:methyl-accepting chemotaxis protein n=1 Tax=Agrobacterium vitis TaxID=373 RepID=UPI001F245F58|nr:HAMP domain-containing methyl-accepting chemotaxis protein [Agrobacterium vitis]WEO75472.1 HAMP domain-containing methyl-accepting chemotaxis protein [Agrobacterium vitis]